MNLSYYVNTTKFISFSPLDRFEVDNLINSNEYILYIYNLIYSSILLQFLITTILYRYLCYLLFNSYFVLNLHRYIIKIIRVFINCMFIYTLKLIIFPLVIYYLDVLQNDLPSVILLLSTLLTSLQCQYLYLDVDNAPEDTFSLNNNNFAMNNNNNQANIGINNFYYNRWIPTHIIPNRLYGAVSHEEFQNIGGIMHIEKSSYISDIIQSDNVQIHDLRVVLPDNSIKSLLSSNNEYYERVAPSLGFKIISNYGIDPTNVGFKKYAMEELRIHYAGDRQLDISAIRLYREQIRLSVV